jgi:hypothetical protein
LSATSTSDRPPRSTRDSPPFTKLNRAIGRPSGFDQFHPNRATPPSDTRSDASRQSIRISKYRSGAWLTRFSTSDAARCPGNFSRHSTTTSAAISDRGYVISAEIDSGSASK